MDKHKRGKLGIRAKLVVFFTMFTAVSLVLLMLFQTVFMDDFYESMKIHTIKKAAQEIAAVENIGELEDYIEYWNVKEQFQVMVVEETGEVVSSSTISMPFLEFMDENSLRSWYQKVKENDGEYFSRQKFSIGIPPYGKSLRPHGDKDNRPPNDYGRGELDFKSGPAKELEKEREFEVNNGVVYALLAENGQMILITAIITPVKATISTLYVQFIIAAVILISFSALMSLFVARSMARPIENINRAAKGLANGTYESADACGYKEIEELQRTLDEVSVELKKTEQLQQELLSNVSHDLRTPLTMITGYSEAIRDLPGEDSAENIQVVIDEANRLTALVNDVLDYSKMQAGVQSFDMQSFELSGWLKRTVERCQMLMASEAYVIHLECDGEAVVCGDEVLLTRVIYNLLGNALVHTGEDMSVSVNLSVYDDRVRISVTDTGSGIPPEELKHIWKRYYQTNSTNRSRQRLGTGIGLSIVQKIIEGHGGLYGVESEVGKGSTFWIELFKS